MSETTASDRPCHWVTTASPTIEAVINPLTAACTEADYVPDVVRILDNPDIADASDRATELIETVVAAHGESKPTIDRVTVESERDFTAIVDYHRQAIKAAQDDDAAVAIDVTPGRKFMSAIAFQAGIQFEADHVYYLYLDSSDYYDRAYPDLPRPGIELVDFTEVF